MVSTMRRMGWTLTLALVLAAGCAEPDPVLVDVSLLTQACGGGADALAEASHLEFVFNGDGLEAPVRVFEEKGAGTASAPELPLTEGAGPYRQTLEVRAHHGSASGPVVAWGRSTYEVTVAEEGTTQVSVPVFVRPTDAWQPPADAEDPSQCAGMTAARAGHTATLLGDGRVLLVGGAEAASAEIYDPAKGRFEALSGVPAALGRTGHQALALAEGGVLVVGGEAGGVLLGDGWIFDPATDAFQAGPALQAPRTGFSFTRLEGGAVVAAGGWTDAGATWLPTASTEVWRGEEAGFAPGPVLPEPKADHCAASFQQGRRLLLGGGLTLAAGDTLAVSDRLHFLSADANEVSLLTDQTGTAIERRLSTPRWGLACAAAQVASQSGSTREVVLVGGGFTEVDPETPGAADAEVEAYDTVVRSVNPGQALADGARGGLCAVSTGAAVVFVGGWSPDDAGASQGSERATLSGSTPAVVATQGSLAQGRSDHACTVLSDGAILVTGGVGTDGSPLASAEIYTPAQ